MFDRLIIEVIARIGYTRKTGIVSYADNVAINSGENHLIQ
jgi:hypothetical protein